MNDGCKDSADKIIVHKLDDFVQPTERFDSGFAVNF